MAGAVLKCFVASLTFAYGVYVFFLYGLIAFCKGAWFRGSTEKERLEFHLGENTANAVERIRVED